MVIVFAMVFAVGSNFTFGFYEMLPLLHDEALEFAFILCGIMLLYVVGFSDDMVGVRYRTKFSIQVLSALMLIMGGLWLKDLFGVIWIHQLHPFAGYALTILVVVFIINAINLIDGVDGLASGLSMVMFVVYGVSFLVHKEFLYALLSFAGFGLLVPFFYFNVFGRASKKQKIFMGDTGSMTLGFMVSVLCIKEFGMSFEYMVGEVNPMVIAFSPLLVPCLDVVRVFLYRIKHHKNPFLPDQNHIHHKLLALGMSQKLTMISVIAISGLFTAVNLILSKYCNATLILFGDIIVWVLFNLLINKAGNRRKSLDNKLNLN